MPNPGTRRKKFTESQEPSAQWITELDKSGKTRCYFGRHAQTVYPPSGANVDADSGWKKPRADLELTWAHGYDGDCVGSLHWTADHEILFPLSGTAVIQDVDDPKQRHFRGHSESVTCIAISERAGICASGQSDPVGLQRPFVAIWRISDCVMWSALVYHSSRIHAVGFDSTGEVVITLGGSSGFEIAIWDVFLPREFYDAKGFGLRTRMENLPVVCREPKTRFSAGTVPAYAMSVLSGPDRGPIRFATYDAGIGKDGMVLSFWTCVQDGPQDNRYSLSVRKATFGNADMPRQVTFGSWTSESRFIACGGNGVFYVFEGNACIFFAQVCKGPLGFAVEVPGLCYLIGCPGKGKRRAMEDDARARYRARRQSSKPPVVRSASRGAAPGNRAAVRFEEDAPADEGNEAMLFFADLHLPTGDGLKETWLGEGKRLRSVGGALICGSAALRLNTAAARGSRVVMGTADHVLLLFDVRRKRLERVLQVSHTQGTWALCHHPSVSLQLCATGSDDATVRFWDLASRQPVIGRVIDFNAPGVWWSQFEDRAAISSLCENPRGVTAIAFGGGVAGATDVGAATLLAVGHGEGTLRVLTFPGLQPIFQDLVSVSRERLSALRFTRTRDGRTGKWQTLAAACWDQCVYLFRVDDFDKRTAEGAGAQPKVSPSHVLDGHTSSVTHIQFSVDCEMLMTNSKDAQMLFFNTSSGERQTSALAVRNKEWDMPWQCVLGWPMMGVWSSNRQLDLTDINSCCSLPARNDSGRRKRGDLCGDLLVCGEDSHHIKLYRFPAIFENQEFRSYTAHASHVTALSFSPEDDGSDSPFLVSLGGDDKALLQWTVRRLVPDDPSPRAPRNKPWIDQRPWKVRADDPDVRPEPVRNRVSLSRPSRHVTSDGVAACLSAEDSQSDMQQRTIRPAGVAASRQPELPRRSASIGSPYAMRESPPLRASNPAPAWWPNASQDAEPAARARRPASATGYGRVRRPMGEPARPASASRTRRPGAGLGW